MEKELRRFLVMLQPNSAAEQLFADDPDAKTNGMVVLTCSTFTIGDRLVQVRRIPVGKNPTGGDRELQVWHLQPGDIAAVFEYTGSERPMGFAPLAPPA